MASKGGIHGFKATRAGEQAVANSGAVQSVLAREAGYKAGNANAAYGKNVYRSHAVQGKFARGQVVSVALGDAKHAFDDAERRESILRAQL